MDAAERTDAATRAGTVAAHVVVAVDTLVGGVHFPTDTPACDVGHKALAVNLSDIAAMGATAVEAVAVVSIPQRHDPAWLASFRAGLQSLADSFGIAVTAVDTVPGALSVTVEVHGHCPAGEALTRAGARAGDRIFVSGTLGDAGGGLEIALGRRATQAGEHTTRAGEHTDRAGEHTDRAGEHADRAGEHADRAGEHVDRAGEHVDRLMARLRRPMPRLALGTALRGLATAAIDISDGLCQDLGHILAQSGVGARVDASLVPLSPALLDVAGEAEARVLALSAGDDYELLFTVAPDRVDRVERLKALEGIESTTEIGVVESEPGLRLVDVSGTAAPAPPGYRHFPSE